MRTLVQERGTRHHQTTICQKSQGSERDKDDVGCAVCDIGVREVKKEHGWKGEYWWVWFEEVLLGAWGGRGNSISGNARWVMVEEAESSGKQEG